MANRVFKVTVKLSNGSTMVVEIQAPNQQAAKIIAQNSHGTVMSISG
jgi:hypothetical protein